MLKLSEQPYFVQVEISSVCNLSCTMCPLTLGETLSSRRVGHMPVELHNKLFLLAKKIGHVLFAGYGEPLLTPGFLELLEQLDAMGVNTSFSTNATMVSAPIAERLARIGNLQNINISIDSPDPEIYSRIRGGPLEAALDGLRNLTAAFAGRKLASGKTLLSVSSVAMRENLESLTALPAILNSLGINVYVLQPLTEWAPELSSAQLTNLESPLPCFETLQRLCEDMEIGLYFDERLRMEVENPKEAIKRYYGGIPQSQFQTKQCMLPWEFPFVDKNGLVFPCCNATSDPAAVMGDLKVQSFDEVWQGESFKRFRTNLLDGRRLNPICSGCKVAPTGTHLLQQYSAQILWDQSRLSGVPPLRLAVRNTGVVPWTPGTRLTIGTSQKRDRISRFYHPTWINLKRVAALSETLVEPGQVGTFQFELSSVEEPLTEVFQLVVAELVWLPDTSFALKSEDLRLTANAARTQKSEENARPAAEDLFSAEILFGQSGFVGHGRLNLVVRNTSRVTWGAGNVRVGTAEPHDRDSRLFFAGWLSANRVCTFAEDLVHPGETATFVMRLAAPGPTSECFQLLVDGLCWLENTKFQVVNSGRGMVILPSGPVAGAARGPGRENQTGRPEMI
ncbi:MAG TPA: radical SAM protein [Acidobacteriota bacterium]|jgi:radical SAM protein with 4Fe4S-binding SPASM domain|nr:radical SAM protein [Acidobacteriota bacterium]